MQLACSEAAKLRSLYSVLSSSQRRLQTSHHVLGGELGVLPVALAMTLAMALPVLPVPVVVIVIIIVPVAMGLPVMRALRVPLGRFVAAVLVLSVCHRIHYLALRLLLIFRPVKGLPPSCSQANHQELACRHAQGDVARRCVTMR